MDADREFRTPTGAERVLHRLFGLLVRLGVGFSYNYLLQVRGRKSGKLYSTPVNVLELAGKRYLVVSRGRTQWVRNGETSGQVTLTRVGHSSSYRMRSVCGGGEAGSSQGLLR